VHVYGIDASRPAVQRSADGGVTWADGAEIVARALLADPTTPGTVYATTEAGLAVSDDDAVSFTVDPAAPALFLIASDAATQELVGVDTGGTLWFAVEQSRGCRSLSPALTGGLTSQMIVGLLSPTTTGQPGPSWSWPLTENLLSDYPHSLQCGDKST
jgi:hypothetical protein